MHKKNDNNKKTLGCIKDYEHEEIRKNFQKAEEERLEKFCGKSKQPTRTLCWIVFVCFLNVLCDELGLNDWFY